MPFGMGVIEPVGLTLFVDDWARTVRKWSALLGAEATVRDFTDDGRKRARFASRSFVTFDLVEAGLDDRDRRCAADALEPRRRRGRGGRAQDGCEG